MMKPRTCDRGGRPLVLQRANARFCSEACKKARHDRQRAQGRRLPGALQTMAALAMMQQ